MKLIKSLTVLSVLGFLLISQTACVVESKTNNGKHKGWNKNTNNPDNANSTNPGKTKKKSVVNSTGSSPAKAKGKGKK